MKFLHTLWNYQKGIRLSSFVLALLLVWAIMAGVLTYAQVQNLTTGLQVLKSAQSENTYFSMHFSTGDEIVSGDDQEMTKDLEATLEAEEMVETVFSVRTVSPVAYKSEGITITLYEPEMLAFFPALKQLGIDFSQEPNGVILGSTIFSDIAAGETVTLNFSKQANNPKAQAFPVAGNRRTPCLKMTLSSASTALIAANLFVEGGSVLMQSTEQVMDQLKGYARRIEYDCSLIVVFKEGYAEEECRALLSRLAPSNMTLSLGEVIENSKSSVSNTFKQQLPQPLFLAISSLFAYFSILILNFKKKERELSIVYILGGSRKKCAMLSLAHFLSSAAVPLLLSSLFVLFWSNLERYLESLKHLFDAGSSLYRVFNILSIQANIDGIGPSCLIIIGAYLAITVCIALAVTLGAMSRHTPLTYMKGASQ